MIKFLKEVGMAFVWLWLGYLFGERDLRGGKND